LKDNYKERKAMRKISMFAMIALVLVMFTGCIAQPTVEEAQQDVEAAESALCESIKAYAATLAAFDEITADTTVEEVEGLNAAAASAYNTMRSAWANLQEEQVQVVENAAAEFEAALSNMPGEATLGEVAGNIQASAATLQEAVDQLDSVACVGAE
jgi:hypothetical protein